VDAEAAPQTMTVRADLDESPADNEPVAEYQPAADAGPTEPDDEVVLGVEHDAVDADVSEEASAEGGDETEDDAPAAEEAVERRDADGQDAAAGVPDEAPAPGADADHLDPLTETAVAELSGAGEASHVPAGPDWTESAEELPADSPPVTAAPLRPGDVAATAIAVWGPEAADRLRGEWQVVAARFVDEPEAALTQAQALVTGAVQQLAEALLAEQVDLDPRHGGAQQPDTEAMRVAMRRYRDFLDRVLSL
jgi:hypothetical protein